MSRISITQSWSATVSDGWQAKVHFVVAEHVMALYWQAYSENWRARDCLAKLPLHIQSIYLEAWEPSFALQSPVHYINVPGLGGFAHDLSLRLVVDNQLFLENHPWFLPVHPTHCFQHFVDSAAATTPTACSESSRDARAFFTRVRTFFPPDTISCAHCAYQQLCWRASPALVQKYWSPLFSTLPRVSSALGANGDAKRSEAQLQTWNHVLSLLKRPKSVLEKWSKVALDDDFLGQCQQVLADAIPFHRIPMTVIRQGLLEWKKASLRMHEIPKYWADTPFSMWFAVLQASTDKCNAGGIDRAHSKMWFWSLPGRALGGRQKDAMLVPFHNDNDAWLLEHTHPILRDGIIQAQLENRVVTGSSAS